MRRNRPTYLSWLATVALGVLAAGCGTTKWSDSSRTATEQMLISDAVDRAISEIGFAALADKSVYLDTRFIVTTLDQNYIVSTLRQHMLASGCIIKDKPEEATYVVEVRTGSLGTNRQDLLFGVPATNLPTAGLLPIGSASIPEIALVKRTNQQGVCKIAVYAYERQSGRPVWQSGNRKVASRAKDIWVLGTGPFQRGTIYDGTSFAGERLQVPLVSKGTVRPESSVAREENFFGRFPELMPADRVENAGYLTPLPNTATTQQASSPATAGSAPGAVPSSADATATAAAPKPAYTPPPLPAAAPLPAAPPPGPQGNLTAQPILPPNANPAAATAGAIQAFGWAKDFVQKKPDAAP